MFQSECLKHLLHNLRSDKGLIRDPVLALNRDSVKGKNQACLALGLSKASKPELTTSTCPQDLSNDQTAHKLVALCHLVESQKSTLQRLTSCLSEADKQRSALLRDLEEERRKNVELAKKAKEITLTPKEEENKDDVDPQVNNRH